MNKKILHSLFFLLLFAPWPTKAATAPEAWADSATAAYDQGNYEEALDHYRAIEADFRSPSLYYNLGNTAFRAGQLGEAVLYFQKARKMDPWNRDVQHNLKLVREELQDEFEQDPPKSLWEGVEEFIVAAPLGGWWTLALILSVLSGVNLALIGLSSSAWRSVITGSALFLLLLGGFAFGAERWQKRILSEEDGAVILSPSVRILHEPHEEASTAFILHEGSSVELRKEKEAWLEIRTPDEQVGWVRKEGIGKF